MRQGYVKLFFWILGLVFIVNTMAYGQSCDILTGSGGDIKPNRLCAPVDVEIAVRYYSSASISDFKIRVDWGDGTYDEYPSNVSYDGSTYTNYISGVTHNYPKGGTQCNYEIVALAIINGYTCTSEFYKANVTVWDQDDSNGGVVSIAPEEYQVCPGEEFTITFDDASTWNCTPPLENDRKNTKQRWTRFVYGINNADANFINGVKVAGVAESYPFTGNIVAHADGQEGPNHTTLNITVPANAQIGEVYEIKLKNWNTCNPYDDPAIAGGPADAENGDYAPVEATARIRIVPSPGAKISIFDVNGTAKQDFCPGEKIKFVGGKTEASVSSVSYSWVIYDDATGTTELYSRSSKIFTFDGFSTPGKKLVKILVQNTGAQNSCYSYAYDTVYVSEAPGIISYINGLETNNAALCNTGSDQAEIRFDINGTNPASYSLQLFKRNSSATLADSTIVDSGNLSVGSNSITHNSATLKQGVYKASLQVIDNATGCANSEIVEVVVYGKPVADFSFPNLCAGQQVVFTDNSSLPVMVNGDALQTWQWDIDYDGTTFNSDYTGNTGIQHVYPTAGSYAVALIVNTTAGCSDTIIKTVTVKPVPNAQLSYSYTGPVCPGTPITFTNTSTNSSADFPDGVSYTIKYTNGVNTGQKTFSSTATDITFNNATDTVQEFSVWLVAQAKAPNLCASISDTLKLKVKPGATISFNETPEYSYLDDNCAPLTLGFVIDDNTKALLADKHRWVIIRKGTVATTVLDQTKNLGDIGYDSIGFTFTNNTLAYQDFDVWLYATKNDLCIQPYKQTYRVNPVPEASFTVATKYESCDSIIYEVTANSSGVSQYNWDIQPAPENLTSVVYDNNFELVYIKPNVGNAATEVNLKLSTNNLFGCLSDTAKSQVNVFPKVISEVALEIVGSDKSCAPFNVQFKNITTNAPTNTNYSLLIQKAGGTTFETAPTSGDIKGDFGYTFTQPGTYLVYLKGESDACTRTQATAASVVVYEFPKPYFNVIQNGTCSPTSLTFEKQNIVDAKRSWSIIDLSTNQPVYQGTFSPSSSDTLSSFTLLNNTSSDKNYRITLSSESSQGCMADSSLVVTVKPEPTSWFEVVGNTTLCEPFEVLVKNNNIIAGATYTWSWGDGTSTTSNAAQLTKSYNNNSYSAPVNYSIKLTTTLNGCSSDSVVSITVAPRVLSNFSISSAQCSPYTLNPTNTSLGFSFAASKWFVREKNGAYEAKGDKADTVKLVNTSATAKVFEVTFLAVNSAGCSDTLTKEITIYPAVRAQLIPDISEGCSPLKVSFDKGANQNNVEYLINWGDGTSELVSTAKFDHEFENLSSSTPRTYQVRLLARDLTSNCQSEITVPITVYPKVTSQIDLSTQKGCGPLSVYFSNISTGATSHEWQVTNVASGTVVMTSNEAVPSVLELANITGADVDYLVSYQASNAQGCRALSEKTITVHTNVVAAFTSNQGEGCSALPVQFSVSEFQPQVRYVWQWGDGAVDTSRVATAEHAFVNTSATTLRQYTVRLIATDTLTGCKSESSQLVRVFPTVMASIDVSPLKGCAPLDLYIVNNSSGANTHLWAVTVNGNTYFTGTDSNPLNLPALINDTNGPLEYKINYTATNEYGCSQTVSKIVTVYPQVRPEFTSSSLSAICGKTAVTFTNTNIQAGVTYTWSFGDGSADIVTNEVTLSHEFVNPRMDVSQNYAVKLTAKHESYPCQVSEQFTVTVYPAFSIAIREHNTEVCANETIDFRSNSSANVTTHTWGVRLKGAGAFTSEAQTKDASFVFANNTGTTQIWEVVYSGTTANGCSNTEISEVIVHPEIIAGFNVNDQNPRLPDAIVSFTNTTNFVGTGWSYNWDFGDGTSANVENPASHTYTAYGKYNVILTVSNGYCEDQYTLPITVEDILPEPSFTYNIIDGCSPITVTFNNTSQYADTTKYLWDFDDNGATSREVNPTYTFTAPGYYQVKLKAVNGSGLDSEEFVMLDSIQVFPMPSARFDLFSNTQLFAGREVYLQDFGKNIDSVFWDFGDGYTSTEMLPAHVYRSKGDYEITRIVKTRYGCTDTAQIIVTILGSGEMRVPNAFIPANSDGDGYWDTAGEDNSVFYPYLDSNPVDYRLRVYNRWGELLFESTDYYRGWNGYYKGRLCKADVYVYKLVVQFTDGKTEQKVGNFTLLR